MEHPKVVRAEHHLFLKNVETESVGDILKLIGTGKDMAKDLPLETLNNCFLVACNTRHRIRVHLFLQWGAHLECKDDLGNTPLLICSKNGCKDLVQFLLQRGADVNARNSSGDTPLILSIRSPGHLDTTRLLLADKKIDVDRQNQAGYTALHTAIEELDLEAIRIMLLANARYDEDENSYRDGQGQFLKDESDMSSENSQELKESPFMLAKRLGLRNVLRILKTIYTPTPLLKACLGRYLESVRLLIDCQFSQVKSPNSLDYNIISEFLRNIKTEERSVSNVEIQIVKELINYGASVNARNGCYERPIASAVMLGSYQLVEILCQYGADLNFEKYISVKSAVELASENGQYEILKLLIRFNAQLTDNESMHHWPLRSALRNGHIQCAQLLLEHGAHLHEDKGVLVFDAIDSRRAESLYLLCQVMPIEAKATVCRYSKGIGSCFIYAVEKGQLDIINILLDIGADVNQKEYSDSPLAHTTDPDVMLTLIKKGANVNSSIGDTRQSPLIRVSQKKNAKFALTILLDAGANVNHCDEEGKSALHFAAKWGDVDNVKIVIDYGADINITSASGLDTSHGSIEGQCTRYSHISHTERR
ncbi:unnamed protein product [Lymnaea stagnalis]|uniref:Uncharacterized protein n=1 Tax=Lymnaea stagnalis TaxID=6523 RepID=A0AAV2HME4_LYMST